MIKLMVIGNLGADAKINQVNGKNVINFSVAHTEKYNDNEKTIWVDCSHWTEKNGIVPYLLKGQQVYVEGQPEIRTWESKDGKAGASLQVRVMSVQLLGSKKQAQEEAKPIKQDDEVPF